MYIISFMFLVGISAGGLIVGRGRVVRQRALPVPDQARVLLSARVPILAAAIGSSRPGPRRWLAMIRQAALDVPLIWDVIIITVYLSIAAIDLYILTRPTPGRRDAHDAFIALPAAVLVHSITAWIFRLARREAFWNTALLAPMSSPWRSCRGWGSSSSPRTSWTARPSGSRIGRLPGPRALMVWFIAVDGFLLFAEILTRTPAGPRPP